MLPCGEDPEFPSPGPWGAVYSAWVPIAAGVCVLVLLLAWISPSLWEVAPGALELLCPHWQRERIFWNFLFSRGSSYLGCDGLVGGRETQLPPLSWDKFRGIVHTAECPVGSGWDFAWSCILRGPPFLLLLPGFSWGQSINKCLAHKSCLGLCRPGHGDNSNSIKPSVGSNVSIPLSSKLQISNSAAAEWVESVSQSEFDSVNQEN